jgi:hypothetical protein
VGIVGRKFIHTTVGKSDTCGNVMLISIYDGLISNS